MSKEVARELVIATKVLVRGPDGDGDCYCKLGGAGMVTVSPDPGCFCGTVGGAGM